MSRSEFTPIMNSKGFKSIPIQTFAKKLPGNTILKNFFNNNFFENFFGCVVDIFNDS